MEERGPITAHIEGLEAHIRGMYDELVRSSEVRCTVVDLCDNLSPCLAFNASLT